MTKTEENIKERDNALFLIYGEILFAIFPFLVKILIVANGFTALSGFFNSSDWSLAGSLLAGQAIIKYSSGLNKYGKRIHWQLVQLQQILLFFLAALCLITYGIYHANSTHTVFLTIWQIFLFVLSLIAFLGYGSFGQYLLDKPYRKR
jgi:hypothetical protein